MWGNSGYSGFGQLCTSQGASNTAGGDEFGRLLCEPWVFRARKAMQAR